MTLVLFQLGWLGDSVMTVPAMWALRKAFPGERILRVINSRMTDFFKGCPYADEILPFERESNKFFEGRRLLSVLKREHVRVFLNLHTPDYDRPFWQYLRDNFFAFATGARERAAYVHSLDSVFINRPVPRTAFGWQRMDKEMLRVVESVSGPLQVDYESIDYWLDEEDFWKVEKLFRRVSLREGEYWVISPFSKRPCKEWDADKWAAVVKETVALTGKKAVVLGAQSDVPKAESLRRVLGTRAVNLVGETSMRTAAGVLRKAKFLLSVDSGLAHLAALMGVPTIVLFGPTPVWRWGPMEERGVVRVVEGEADCAPCFEYNCDDRICMASISVEKVMKAVNSILEAA